MTSRTTACRRLLPILTIIAPLTMIGCRGPGRDAGIGSPGTQTRPAPKPTKRPKPLPPDDTLPSLANIRIIVDPGHGGGDPGAWEHTLSRLPEKNIALDIARHLADILRRHNGTIIMTRNDDRYIDLPPRAALAKRHRANLLVSIHANAAGSREAVGTEVYIARAASNRSKQVANSVDAAIRRAGITSRGVKPANFVVLADHPQPAILVECGFLTNPSDSARLNDPDYRRRFAAIIAEGILNALATQSTVARRPTPPPARLTPQPANTNANVISPTRRPLVP